MNSMELNRRSWLGHFVALIGSVFLALVVVSPVTAAEEAQALVERTTNEMLSILKENRERVLQEPGFLDQQVERLIIPHLDFEAMTKLAVAAHWRKADRNQRASLVGEFRTLLLRTYTKSLGEFRDQQIEFVPYRKSSRADRAVVRSRIIQSSGGPAISLEYRLRKLDVNWQIYDISIDNISLVTSYRTSFASQIRQTGLDGLIASLAQKNTRSTP